MSLDPSNDKEIINDNKDLTSFNDANANAHDTIDIKDDEDNSNNNNNEEEEKKEDIINNKETLNEVKHHSLQTPDILNNLKIKSIKVGKGELKGSFRKYHVYPIICTPSIPNIVKVTRRYSDFVWLRNCFLQMFPGVLIPSIPPKIMLRKWSDDTIEYRKYGFERFLNYILKIDIFYNSQVFKIFITKHEDSFEEGKKLTNERLQERSLKSIGNIYNNIFPKYMKMDLPQDYEERCLMYKTYIETCEKQLTDLIDLFNQTYIKTDLLSHYSESISENIDQLYLTESEFPFLPKQKRLNIAGEINKWSKIMKTAPGAYSRTILINLKYELQDVKAFQELITNRLAIVKELTKYTKKSNKWKEREQDLSAPVLTPKQENTKINDLKQEKHITELLECLTKLLLFYSAPKSWKVRITNFRSAVKEYAKIQLGIAKKLVATYSTIVEEVEENDW